MKPTSHDPRIKLHFWNIYDVSLFFNIDLFMKDELHFAIAI